MCKFVLKGTFSLKFSLWLVFLRLGLFYDPLWLVSEISPGHTEKRDGVCDIKISEHTGADKMQIQSWEKKFACMMPDDLKNFYYTSNGFLLTWSVKMTGDTKIPVGRMEINTLDKLAKLSTSVKISESESISIRDLLPSDDESESDTSPRFDYSSRLFELDSCGGFGKVCLAYKDTKSGIPAQNSEIWFLDRGFNWHFISDSFLGYFRLMLTHLGLPHWQYSFTDTGVPPQSQQWYNMFCRTRLKDGVVTSDSCSSSSQLSIDRVFKNKGLAGRKPPPIQNLKKKPTAPLSAGKAPNTRISGSNITGKPMR